MVNKFGGGEYISPLDWFPRNRAAEEERKQQAANKMMYQMKAAFQKHNAIVDVRSQLEREVREQDAHQPE